ncbi:MAG: bifunctional diaminohydroxyphosphoribosylaminopyrimidine deaminase/5-amino-6-(5-phosphoribosylamino)uracil reductase RibD [bacterium]|nr:bifunctional diaminohydroxyphosphoribosylaminopyrimidine deaminase/5-amino-6-(5-phosphoribosylamino)uracil reductase RibD [bacterium]
MMSRALSLARQGRFMASPNPRVGCVIVQAHPGEPPRIIGEGFHEQSGKPHAERVALSHCSENPAGATMYVSLEPCCHHGRTPPCTDAIVEAGIARVVAAVADPFPQVSGKGFEILRESGIEVETGVLEEEAAYENRFFMHAHQRGLPWVILKTACSLDGKSATASGHSQWITSPRSRGHVHEMRAEVDAILAGIGTIKADDPGLTARPPDLPPDSFRQPTRVIVDPLLETPLSSRLFATRDQAPLWFFCGEPSPAERKRRFEENDARVSVVSRDGDRLNLLEILTELAADSIQSLWIEGGPTLHTAFLDSQLVNELFIYIAPVLIGGAEAPSFYMGRGAATMDDALRLERIRRRLIGEDTLVRGIVRWRL